MPSLNTVFLLSKALGIKPSELIERLEKLKPRPQI